jgi:hypothetical protein
MRIQGVGLESEEVVAEILFAKRPDGVFGEVNES